MTSSCSPADHGRLLTGIGSGIPGELSKRSGGGGGYRGGERRVQGVIGRLDLHLGQDLDQLTIRVFY